MSAASRSKFARLLDEAPPPAPPDPKAEAARKALEEYRATRRKPAAPPPTPKVLPDSLKRPEWATVARPEPDPEPEEETPVFREEKDGRATNGQAVAEPEAEPLWTCPGCGAKSKRARCYRCNPRSNEGGAAKASEGATKEFAVAAKVAELLAGLPGPAALRVLGWVRESLESSED